MNLEERKAAFLDGYKHLIDEHKVDFVTIPGFSPDGQGGWKFVLNTTIMDTQGEPTKSPFQMESN